MGKTDRHVICAGKGTCGQAFGSGGCGAGTCADDGAVFVSLRKVCGQKACEEERRRGGGRRKGGEGKERRKNGEVEMKKGGGMRRNERGREERKTRMGTALSAAQLTAVTTESNRRCSTELCAGLGAEVAVGKSVEHNAVPARGKRTHLDSLPEQQASIIATNKSVHTGKHTAASQSLGCCRCA
eukprot:3143512-Rhodomonas_salina.1